MKPIVVLYVEDYADLRSGFQEGLEGHQPEVVACAAAEETPVLWKTRHFDVLVSDIRLPGMSGTDLAGHILAQHSEGGVVLCSGYEHGDSLRKLGPCVRALAKPFELEELDRLTEEIQMLQGNAP